jgi:hypothetical protein
MDYPELIFRSPDNILLKKSDGSNYEEPDFLQDKVVHTMLFVYASIPFREEHRFTVNISEINSSSELLNRVIMGHAKYSSALLKVEEKRQRIKELLDKVQPVDESADVDWKALVLQEEQLRLSEEISIEYRLRETDSSFVDWIEYTATVLQPRLLEANGIKASPSNLLKLRVAAQDTNVFWVKYNRAKRGDYGVGDAVPDDVWLHDTQSRSMVHINEVSSTFRSPSSTALLPTPPSSSALFQGRPLVLLAGSES